MVKGLGCWAARDPWQGTAGGSVDTRRKALLPSLPDVPGKRRGRMAGLGGTRAAKLCSWWKFHAESVAAGFQSEGCCQAATSSVQCFDVGLDVPLWTGLLGLLVWTGVKLLCTWSWGCWLAFCPGSYLKRCRHGSGSPGILPAFPGPQCWLDLPSNFTETLWNKWFSSFISQMGKLRLQTH